jgi:hypothetical protein
MLPKLQPGQVWTNQRYYQDDVGTWKPKHALILAIDRYDITHRPFTKKGQDRSTNPPCGHEPKYRPAYFVGAGILPPLPRPTWVDLAFRDDDDVQLWEAMFNAGHLRYAGSLSPSVLCAILICAAGSGGTTHGQRRKIMDVRGVLGCA